MSVATLVCSTGGVFVGEILTAAEGMNSRGPRATSPIAIAMHAPRMPSPAQPMAIHLDEPLGLAGGACAAKLGTVVAAAGLAV